MQQWSITAARNGQRERCGQVAAPSANAAIKKVQRVYAKYNLTGFDAWQARRTSANFKFWRAVWHKACANMPTKRHATVNRVKLFRLKNVPEYIRANAKGRPIIHKNGHPYAEVTYTVRVPVGQTAALARALGYLHKKGNYVGKPDSYGMFNRIRYGSRPRNPVTRKKLLRLAGMK